MIKDEKEYEYSKECVRRFEHSIAALEQDEENKKNDPSGWQLSCDVKETHLIALREEIAEYERLVNHKRSHPIKITVRSLVELPKALIKARIAAGITKKDLADRLGIDELRVEEYEKTDYQCASFVEIIDVAEVLAVDLKEGNFVFDFQEMERRKAVLAEFLQRQQKKLINSQQP
jgi:transcriptional regulator with XRE-family HTH domain